jgi:site-specific DNA-cytosine methylase
MRKNINVISTFDGIATGLVALKELGYEPNYYASEIEQNAISIAMKNHPEIVQMGDVTRVRYKDGFLEYVIKDTTSYEEWGTVEYDVKNVGKIDLLIKVK